MTTQTATRRPPAPVRFTPQQARRRRIIRGLPAKAVLAVLLIVVLYPMVWLLLGSFKTNTEFLENPVWALPETFSFDNYAEAWTTGNIAQYVTNSVIAVFPALFLMILLGSAAGFALEVMVWKGRGGVLLVFLAGIMVPGQMILLPLFTVYFQTGLSGTLWPLIITYTATGLPLTVFMMAAYFRAVPREGLYASAHGLYEAEINGARVGDDILSPGWTVYGKRLRYYTYDVTAMLRQGENALGAWLADGWYRGRIGFNGGQRNLYGTDQSFIAQLEITYADGSRETVATGPAGNWRAAFGPLLATSLYDGEEYDQRLEMPGWSRPGFDDSSWEPVQAQYRDPATLIPSEGPPIRCTEELFPQTVSTSPSGKILLDFGQNLVGRLRLRVSGAEGDRVMLRHAEVLQNGELYTRPLREARSTDVLTLSGESQDGEPTIWEPRFAIHGFRYVEVTGWPGVLDSADITARVYHSDMRRTGWFECSDPLINRLHENIRWSMRGNFVDIPTDCPQRDERLGWTGDIQVFAPTASYLYDCSGMLSSWLRDVALEQHKDGTVPWYVPVIPGGEMWTPVRPGAVWGDAAVLTPWVLHERFADRAVLARQYDSAKAWVDLVDRLSGPSHLWNEGFQLGDWLDPNAPPDDPAAALTDKHLVATAYFAWSARKLGETAKILGKEADAEHYLSLAAGIREAFTSEYCLPDGKMTSDAQTAYALAINFELIGDPELLMLAGKRLRQLVQESNYRIATGFAGTPAVCDALTATGNVDTAYQMLLEKECPSWLYTVEQGGTTIWERWDSLRPDGTVNPGGMTSFNHYALGAVADWMHRRIGGIAPLEPGYRKVRIAPLPGGDLSFAESRFDSPYGRISSRWEREDSGTKYTFTVPTGVSAVVSLPGLTDYTVGPGTYSRHTSR